MADETLAWVIWHPKKRGYLASTARESRFQCIVEAMFQDKTEGGWLRMTNEEIEAQFRDEWESIGIRCVPVRLVEVEEKAHDS